jgi:tetratricopeptide (TPR) repeat protein
MEYCNKNRFETLKKIGDNYTEKENYSYFASYCYSKEKGLKQEAQKDLKDYIEFIHSENILEQREIANEITTLSYNNKKITEILPYPLKKLFISIFLEWIESEDENYLPQRWLGYLEHDIAYYEKAYKLNPNDDVSILEIIRFEIESVAYQVHHIAESALIGTVQEARDSLNKIELLAKHVKDSKIKGRILDTASKYEELLEKWAEYKQLDCNECFGEWYKSQN